MRHQLVRQVIVVGEERRHVGAERNPRGAGQRGEIGDQRRLVLIGQRQRVGEDETAFGIGIADLDGDALARLINVAWAESAARDRILHGRDQYPQPHLEFARHDHVRQRQRRRRPAHVFLHIQHGRVRLDVETAGIEAHALADQRHTRMMRFAPGQIDQPRRPRGGTAHGVDQRKILFQQIVTGDHVDAGVVLRRHRARRIFELGRPHIVRRRVDEVAHQRDRLDHTLEILAIDALRQIELDLAAFGLVVARKAIGTRGKGQGSEPRVMRIVGEAVNAAGQLLRQPPGEKQVLGVGGVFEPEQDAAQAALPGQCQIVPRLRLETRRVSESPHGGGEPLAHFGIARGGNEPDRDRRRPVGG